MALKVLSVDDSKSVRILVKRSFKKYDVNIVEAEDGLKGLQAAEEHLPDLILLDVTMPNMDGVEMLTKLKENPKLKAIPVIMLTAEAGKDNVMRIAKIGVRDYIVKPFEEASLIEKVKRIVDLQEKPVEVKMPESIEDTCNVMVVEDKPAIIDQIKNGFNKGKWSITGAASVEEAKQEFNKKDYHSFLVSLGLPEGEGLSFYRFVRSQAKAKPCPVFGMVVKTAQKELKEAQDAGFDGVFTKPLNIDEVEGRMISKLKLNTSSLYFSQDESATTVNYFEGGSETLSAVASYAQQKLEDTVNSGLARIILDISQVESVNLEVFKSILEITESCSNLGLEFVLLAPDSIKSQFDSFTESKSWAFAGSLEEAKSASATVA